MGDMILTLPIIKSIKLFNPKVEIHVYGSNKNIKILKNFKYIEKIFNIDENIIYNEKYDLLLNFSPGWKSFFKTLILKSSKKASIIYTSRYKKKKFSKLFIKILSKIFFNKTFIVNRIKKFEKSESIHQTLMMYELLKMCKISFENDISIENYFVKNKVILSDKKICLLHLSSKWINNYYDENDFLELIKSLELKFNLIMTSDETTTKKFMRIYENFKIIKNNQFKNFNKLNATTIFENMNFENWIQLILSSKLVITPECGCTHVAALCKVPSKIIYDPENEPDMIHSEYAPWKNNYEKFIFNEKNLNALLIKVL